MQKEKQSSGAKANTSESDVCESVTIIAKPKGLRDISRMLWASKLCERFGAMFEGAFCIRFLSEIMRRLYEVCLSLVSASARVC